MTSLIGFQNDAELYLESGQGIVVMTNSDHGYPFIQDVIVPAVRDRYGWPAPVTVDSDAPVVGRFLAGSSEFTIAGTGDTLHLTTPGQPPLRLRRDDRRWRADVLNLDVRFRGDTMILHQTAQYTTDVEAHLVPGG